MLLIIVNKLQEDQQKRIMPKFNDKENKLLDVQIRKNIFDMTQKIKECEDNIKQLSYINLTNLQEERGNYYYYYYY